MIHPPLARALRPILLGLVVVFVYLLCLKLGVPGYFAPFAPFHGDFYDYTGMAGVPWKQVLRYPRPVTFAILKVIGAGDVRGSMAAGVGIALADVLLILLYAEKLRPIARPLPWTGAALYCALLFTHPQFYIEHRHDMPAMFSLLFALLALHCWLAWLRHSSWIGLLFCPLCIVAFAFSKEAFYLSLIALAVPMLVFFGRRLQTLGFLIFCLLAEGVAFVYSRKVASPFVDSAANATSTYFIDAHPGSVLHVLTVYADALVSWPMAALIAIGLAQAFWKKQSQLFPAAFILAGVGALLPISLLPNHVFPEYSWLAVPFVFIPVAFLEFPRRVSRPVQVGAVAVVLASFLRFEMDSKEVFGTSQMQWYVLQESIGRNLLASFSQISPEIARSRHLTVTGLDTPFLPWASDSYVSWRFGNDRLWSVIVPKNEANWRNSRTVQFVTAPQANLSRPGTILVYNENGAFERSLPEHPLHSPVELVPEIHARAETGTPKENEAIGARYAHWSLFAEALPYLQRAAGNHDPQTLFDLGRAEWLSGDHENGLKQINEAIASAASPEPLNSYRAQLAGLQTQKPATQVAPTLEIVPGKVTSPDRSGLAIVTVKWRAPEGLPIEIHVGAFNGPLLATASGSGSAPTGKWVRDQTRFYLQDVSAGKGLSPENTLAQAAAQVR